MTIQRSSGWTNSKLTFSIKLLRCSHIYVCTGAAKWRLPDLERGDWWMSDWEGCVVGDWGEVGVSLVYSHRPSVALGQRQWLGGLWMHGTIHSPIAPHSFSPGWLGANAIDISTHEKLWLIMLGLLLWVICWLVIWELWRQPFIQCSTIHGRDDRSCVI